MSKRKMSSDASNSNGNANATETETPVFDSETGELEQVYSERFFDGYEEDLMGDDEDRARLYSMSEKDREMELFDRAERRDTLKNRWNIRMKLQLKKKRNEDEQNKNDLEDKQMDSNTSTSTNSNAMGELSINEKCDTDAQNEESSDFLKIFNKNDLDKPSTSAQTPCERDEDLGESSDESSDSSSDETADQINGFDLNSYDSNEEDLQGNVTLPPTVTKNDLNSILLTRSKIEELIQHPSFDELVKGCLVKVSIGKKNGVTIYRLTNVESTVDTIKTCLIGDIVTNKAFRIRHGHQTRVFRLEFISNNTVTNTDIVHWSFACEDAQIRIPEKWEIQKKAKDIKEALKYKPNESVTPETEPYNLQRRSPINYAEKKKQLMEERDYAIIQNNTDLQKILNEEIKNIDDMICEQNINCDYGESSSYYPNLKSDEDSSNDDAQNKEEEEQTKMCENEEGIETVSAEFGGSSTSAIEEDSVASEAPTLEDNGSKIRISLDEYRKRWSE